MAAASADLRPRGPAELYDAALHLCLRGETALPALALVGASLPAGAGLLLAFQAMRGKPLLLWSGLFALALLLRALFAGAAGLAGEAALEERELGPWPALKAALGRGATLMSASGMTVLLDWVAQPLSLFSLSGALSPLLAVHLVAARGEAGPWSAWKVCRQRLSREPVFQLRVLHLLACLVVLANLHGGLALALYLGRALLALDVAFLEQLASLRNGFYDLFLVACTFWLLEPVKAALAVVALADSRVRSEGLDLAASLERLREGRRASAVIAALALVVVLPGAARARPAQDAAELRQLAEELNLSRDPEVQKGLERAGQLRGPDALALQHLVARLRAQTADDRADEAKAELREAMRALDNPVASQPAVDAQAMARAILSRPEFERLPDEQPKEAKEAQPSKPPDWLVRFLRWLFGGRESSAPSGSASLPGLQAGVFETLVWVLIGLALVVGAVVAGRALLSRAPRQPGAAAAAGPAAKESHEADNALARPPAGWWEQAELLAQRGDYREATRALYLAVLSALHRRGAIDYQPTCSNWDYVRAFRGADGELAPFRELTRRFDFAWYGRQGADAEAYRRVRALVRPLLGPVLPEAASA